MRLNTFYKELKEFSEDNSPKRIAFLKKINKQAKNDKDYTLYHCSAYYIAEYYAKRMEVGKAKKILTNIMVEIPFNKFIKEYIHVFNVLGIIEGIEDNFELAIYYYNHALALAKKHHISDINSTLYSNISTVYGITDHHKSIEYLEKAIKYSTDKRESSHATYHLNLAIHYKALGEYEKALKHMTISENKYNIHKYKPIVINTQRMDLYYKMENWNKFYEIEEVLEKELFDNEFNYEYFITYQILGSFFISTKNSNKLEKIINILEKYLNSPNNTKLQLYIYELKYEYAKLNDDYPEMCEMLLKQNELHNVIHQEYIESNVQAVDLRIKYSNSAAKALTAKKLNTMLKKQLRTDTLTGLKNRHAFNIDVQPNLKKIVNAKSIAFILMDVDNFKSINDIFGHLAGDDVLQSIGKSMLSLQNPNVSFYRFGGDEFIGMVYNHSKEEVYDLALKLKNSIEETKIIPNFTVTLTQGIYQINSQSKKNQIKESIDFADKAMYKGKSGKGQIMFFT